MWHTHLNKKYHVAKEMFIPSYLILSFKTYGYLLCFIYYIKVNLHTCIACWLYVLKIRRNSQHRVHKYDQEKKEAKQTAIFAGHHYAQASTNNVNKTWALLQTTGGKDDTNGSYQRNGGELRWSWTVSVSSLISDTHRCSFFILRWRPSLALSTNERFI
jgi:hypothetical protein